MNVTCPDCHSVFRVDPAKVPGPGLRARCSVCGGVIAIAHPTPATMRQPAAAPAPADEFDSGILATAEADQFAAEPVRSRGASDAAPTHTEVPPGLAAQPSAEVAAEGTSQSRPARPFNPYLSNTPELRARRLARALVSDLVAYNPQKREEGLRDGTLRQLFRDEIRKSWDEYVEQVGAQVAESTPHFQDALNDVLAGGRRVF